MDALVKPEELTDRERALRLRDEIILETERLNALFRKVEKIFAEGPKLPAQVVFATESFTTREGNTYYPTLHWGLCGEKWCFFVRRFGSLDEPLAVAPRRLRILAAGLLEALYAERNLLIEVEKGEVAQAIEVVQDFLVKRGV